MRIGIDCGVTGAIALINGPNIVNMWDIPTYTEVTAAGKKRNFVCSKALDVIFTEIGFASVPGTTVYVEKQGPNKGAMVKDSPLVAYSIGYNYSTIREALRRSGADYREVQSVSWKRRAGLKKGATKKDALYLARALFRDNTYFKRIKDHNRAEAGLIAYFGD